MADMLSMWWVHTVTVERYAGDGAEGPTWAPPETFRGFVNESRKLVRNTAAEQTLSTRQVFLPIEAGRIPPMSRLTHEGDARTVISSAERSAGALPVPAHVEVSCE